MCLGTRARATLSRTVIEDAKRVMHDEKDLQQEGIVIDILWPLSVVNEKEMKDAWEGDGMTGCLQCQCPDLISQTSPSCTSPAKPIQNPLLLQIYNLAIPVPS